MRRGLPCGTGSGEAGYGVVRGRGERTADQTVVIRGRGEHGREDSDRERRTRERNAGDKLGLYKVIRRAEI